MISEEQSQFTLRRTHIKKLGEDVIHSYSSYEQKSKQFVKTKIQNETFELPAEFQIVSYIGQGNNGIAVSAFDRRNKQKPALVVIKKMINSFQHRIFARRVLRRIKILRLLKHQNIIKIITIILPKSREQLKDLYIVIPFAEFDFLQLINSQTEMTEECFQFYLHEILRSIKYIHSAKIIHRDIKPKSIIFNENNDIRIKSFGQSKFVGSVGQYNPMSQYMGTRWYQAPENLVGELEYTQAVDIWSVGCVFAQLWTRKPFLRANSTKQQFSLIIKTLNIDDEKIENLYPGTMEKLSPTRKKSSQHLTLDQILKKMSPSGQDLFKRMLAFLPQQRITADECLNHEYLSHLNLEEGESELQEPIIDQKQFEFDNYEFTLQQFKDLIYQEILLYHSHEFAQQYERKKKEGESLFKHILENSNAKLIDSLTDSHQGDDY